jgi:hypothetical protein
MKKYVALPTLLCLLGARLVFGDVVDDAAAAAAAATAPSTSNEASTGASSSSSPSDVLGRPGPGAGEGSGFVKAQDEAAGTQGEQPVDHGYELMKWVERTDGAYFHPHLTIRRMGGGGGGGGAGTSSLDAESETASRNASQPAASSSPFYGMYAVDDIAPGELLLEIPRSMVFHPDDPAPGDRVVRYYPVDDQYYPGTLRRIDEADGSYTIAYDDQDYEVETGVDPDDVAHEDYPSCCATVHKLVREMRLGGNSVYGPYVQYLLSQPSGQLPTSWSPLGQALLKRVLGAEPPKGDGGSSLEVEEEGEEVIQPYGSFGWVEDDWHARCKGGKDALSENAYLLLAQRGWDEVMIPGRCINTS